MGSCNYKAMSLKHSIQSLLPCSLKHLEYAIDQIVGKCSGRVLFNVPLANPTENCVVYFLHWLLSAVTSYCAPLTEIFFNIM